MLRSITVEGFRCFDTPTSVELGDLILLAGSNSTGKSSVIHALMALLQSVQQQSRNSLLLSGEWVDLGSFSQVVNSSRSREQRQFSLGLSGKGSREGEEFDIIWTLVDPGDRDDVTAEVARISRVEAFINGIEVLVEERDNGYQWSERRNAEEAWAARGMASFPNPGSVFSENTKDPRTADIWKISGTGRSFLPYNPMNVLYLGASRLAPQRQYHPSRGTLGPLLGRMGEHTAEMILKRQRSVIDILPQQEDAQSLPFGKALNAWWSHIFARPYSLRVDVDRKHGFTFAIDTPSAENLEIGQVGLGLSQVLPILVLGLCSKPGDIVVVETPEAHLHPVAQHRLCEFFILLARGKRQVVLETHSDHFVNAVRLAAKSGSSSGLLPEQIAVHFFNQADDVTSVERLSLDEFGRFNKWPAGFFDQASQTLLELLR